MKISRYISAVVIVVSILFSGCREIELSYNEEDIPSGKDTLISIIHGSDYLFDKESLPTVRLEIELKDWDRLLEMYDINKDNEECIPGALLFSKEGDEMRLDSIGIRLRGNTSRRRPEGLSGEKHKSDGANWHHCHFGLRLDKYIPGQKLCKVDKINLRWFKDDAMYCREMYCYDLFERFGVWSAPRASYCKLEVWVKGDENPTYYGVYALTEAIDKSYLKNRRDRGYLNSKDGNLWKASWGANFYDMSSGKIGVEEVPLDPSKAKRYAYDLKTNKEQLSSAKSELLAFSKELNALSGDALKSWLEANMDVDLFLRAYAVNVVVGMWDDYWKNMNNYYWYFDGDGKFIFIPYDYDNTLGTSSLMNNSGTQDPMNWGENNERPLIKKVLSISEYRSQYKGYLKELVNSDELFGYTGSKQRIERWHALISDHIINDTGEDVEIIDKPASWGNCHSYRLFTGDDSGNDNGNCNYFKTRTRVVNNVQ